MKSLDANGAWKRLGSRLAPWFVLLAAFVQIGLGFHHHDDLRTHDDCRVCLAGHQGPEPESLRPVALVLARGAVEFLASVEGLAPVDRRSLPATARGPPSPV